MAPRIRTFCDLKAFCSREDGDVVWLLSVPWMPWTILSAIRCLHFANSGHPDYDVEADDLQVILPNGVEVIGVLLVCKPTDAAKAAVIARNIRKSLNCTPGEVIAATGSSQTGEIKFCSNTSDMLEYEEIDHTFVKDFWDCTTLVHSQMQLNLSIYTSSQDSSDYDKQVHIKIRDILRDLTSSKIVFLMEGASRKIALQLSRPCQNEAMLISDFLPVQPLNATPSGAMSPNPLDVKVLMQQCNNDRVSAPVVQYIPAGSIFLHDVKISLDVLSLVARNSPLSKATNSVTRAVCMQLESMGKLFVRRNGSHQPKLQAYHFILPGILHPITTIYDISQSESDALLVEARKSLHSRFQLPLDRPILRVANALTIKGSEIVSNNLEGGKRLLNVHAGLPRCGISGGQMSIIQGAYEYFHYLQDRCDDNGWGCAYRSLQTIVSWFRLQHYTSLPVPSHREIQEILVEIGDKEPSFIGSQEWVGAIELSFVLDKVLGVTSKILNVRSGAELPEKCRELAAHFDTQGTPVMIGGGVLAYTLLGVDYNEHTGESAFLILDPHYTGGEDLKTIRNGGWCGWKKAVSETGQEFFLRNKFYNLLLPQRPQTV